MTVPSLVLEKLEVRRFPGFQRLGFTLQGLSPGINIIVGPNGSGKSTIIRAFLQLLKSGSASGEASLRAELRLGDSHWLVELDPSQHRWQRDGRPAERPAWPDGAQLQRYCLSLTELLQATERGGEFVAHIIKESSGGYDLEAAAAALSFGTPPPGRQGALSEFRKAREQLTAVRDVAEQLRAEEERLAELEQQRSAAATAATAVDHYRAALDLLATEEKVAALKKELKRFPQWVHSLTGQETEMLEELAARRGELLKQRDQALSLLQAAERELTAVNLPPEGIPHHHLHRWRLDVHDLRALETSVAQAQAELAAAVAIESEEMARLGDAISPEKAAAITGQQIDLLARMTGEAEEMASRRRELIARLRSLPALEPGMEKLSPEQLRKGISLLSQWLGESSSNRAEEPLATAIGRWLPSLALMVAAGERFLAGNWWWSLSLLVAAGVVTFLTYIAKNRDLHGTNLRKRYEEQFAKLELPISPADWTEERVATCLHRLESELQRLIAFLNIEEQRRWLQEELDRVTEEEDRIREQRQHIALQLGLPADLGLAGVSWLGDRIKAWQEIQVEAKRLQAAIAQSEAQLRDRLKLLAEQLAPLGFSGIDSPVAAVGALAELERRVTMWSEAQDRLREARAALSRCDEELERCQQQRRQIFSRLGLDDSDPQSELTLKAMVEQLPEIRALQQRYHTALQNRDAARHHFDAIGADPQLLNMSRWELEQALLTAEKEAARLEELAFQIGGIKAKIEAAKEDTAMSQALARFDAAEDKLRRLFHKELELTLGSILVELLQEESRDSRLPKVFHRARNIFSQITFGRYRLDLNENAAEPAFHAIEQSTGEGYSLDQLSDGTRLQLLLAVRMAFVEEHEHVARLPLFLDEVLASSDDQRTWAIMESVHALARAGRQIFYLTAQWDEVAKWKELLSQRPLPHSIVDLARLRQLEAAARRPLVVSSPLPEPSLPPPPGPDYIEYGKLLGVPNIDPDAENVDNVHLWHLLEDVDELYALLQLGAKTWGPLRWLVETQGSQILANGLETVYAKATAGARALARALDLWRQGRGRRVTRDVLLSSGAISNRFIDRVSAVAAETRGDSASLMKALETPGKVPHLRRDAVERLRSYLEQHGYLDYRPRLNQEQIRLLVTAASSQDLNAGLISHSLIDRIVALLTREVKGDFTLN